VRLLIDEQLSPRLVQLAAELGVYVLSVPHAGIAGRPDAFVWDYAFRRDLTVLTTNARDFKELLDVELHPGLIVAARPRDCRSDLHDQSRDGQK
jgi:predicted nuclease of predicted toxin-antitoxin system